MQATPFHPYPNLLEIYYHGDVSLKYLLDEFVSRGMDQLDDVSMEGIPIFLQEPYRGEQREEGIKKQHDKPHNVHLLNL